MVYLYRLMYSFGHINVYFPSTAGYFHWIGIKLGYLVIGLLGIGFLLGYTTKSLGKPKKCRGKKQCR